MAAVRLGGLSVLSSAALLVRAVAEEQGKDGVKHHRLLVVGGGTGGLTVASQFHSSAAAADRDVAIIEPSKFHYYQPLWTLVGGGVYPKEESMRPYKQVHPSFARHIATPAKSFDPANNTVVLANGEKVTYDYLVVAAGIQIDWKKIPGLSEGLADPACPVVSIYDYEHAEKTWQKISTFNGGNIFFTQPSTAIKCGGAPQKVMRVDGRSSLLMLQIMWLAEANFRERGVRPNANIVFWTPLSVMFGVGMPAPPLHSRGCR